MAPPWRFSIFPLELEKMSYTWLKLALFGKSNNCQYFRSEMEIQKSPRWRQLYPPKVSTATGSEKIT